MAVQPSLELDYEGTTYRSWVNALKLKDSSTLLMSHNVGSTEMGPVTLWDWASGASSTTAAGDWGQMSSAHDVQWVNLPDGSEGIWRPLDTPGASLYDAVTGKVLKKVHLKADAGIELSDVSCGAV